MSIAALCDHRAVVYRPRPESDPSTRDELGDVLAVFDPLTAPAGLNCRPNQNWSGNLQDNGPGEQQGAMRQWFLVAGFDVAERDVLSIESGPESPVLLKVESVTRPTAPLTLHHYEVNVSVYQGSVTEAATS